MPPEMPSGTTVPHGAAAGRFDATMRPLQTFITGGRAPDPAPPATPPPPDGALPTVAYFSPEFGVSSGLPQYAGGLGILAGDHLKAADALDVPVVGIGLFYDHGYFTQHVDPDGTQHAHYPNLDAVDLGLTAVDDVLVGVEVGDAVVHARLWKTLVGHVPLYLLDTDIAVNDPDDRRITDRLYGGGPRERLRQELVLGVGGVRALAGLGVTPGVFHLNEGHAGFSLLERLRRVMVDDGLDWDEAVEAVRPAGVFTTHTPVPAGIDRFDAELIEEHFGGWCAELGVPVGRLLDLGHEPGTPAGSAFNMAVLCLRLCGHANGVSRLHGAVSRTMFAPLWPSLPTAEAPIGSITNGVDAATWVAPPMAALLTDHLGPDWATAPPERWEAVAGIDDDALWDVRSRQRRDLLDVVRARLDASGRWAGAADGLDPDALTIGFARRFATYKRAALLTGDPDALAALVGDGDRPVQFVFAGKAHPNDTEGQALIAELLGCASDLGVAHRVVFVEDYDMDLAAAMVAGCDVWLNTPVRPMEACGTSGMKAALNGGLNCSIPDGWWDEWGSDEVGWVVPSDDDEPDPARRDTLERESVYEVLTAGVVPTFFERDATGRPHRWLSVVRASLGALGPRVVATRMVGDYVAHAYLPAVRRTAALADPNGAAARVRQRRRLEQLWPAVGIDEVHLRPARATTDLVGTAAPGGDGDDPEPGDVDVRVEAEVCLGEFDDDEVVVEAVWGPVDASGEFTAVTTEALAPPPASDAADRSGVVRYTGSLRFGGAGEVGVSVRVVPRRPIDAHLAPWGVACWAQATNGRPSSTA
jgi:starch phosphorylase